MTSYLDAVKINNSNKYVFIIFYGTLSSTFSQLFYASCGKSELSSPKSRTEKISLVTSLLFVLSGGGEKLLLLRKSSISASKLSGDDVGVTS